MRRSSFFQISLVFSVMMLVFFFHTMWPVLVSGREFDYPKTLTASIYGGGFVVFATLLFLREAQTARLIQVLVIIALGILVTVFVTPREIGGDLMFVLAAVMAYKYGFLNQGLLPKLVVIVGALIATRVGLVVFTDSLRFRQTIGQFAIATGIIPIVYWIFEDELQRTAREKRRLELRARDNQPFVEFGRNVSGIAHDFKNDLGLFSMFGQLLRINQGEPVSDRQLTEYEGYVQRFSDRIARILAVTRVSQVYDVRFFDLADLLRSVMYVFRSNLDFKPTVHFSVDIPDTPLEVSTYPAEIVSIMENVVRNSCEALVEHYADREEAVSKAFLSVSCNATDMDVTIVVGDNGPGISHCAQCPEKNCLECSLFGIGKTTKVNGSGLGLINVRTAARRIGARIVMKSAEGQGVQTEIVFPRRIGSNTR